MNLFSHIKQRISILDVVSEYAQLKRAGHYWKGRCPFHHERTASFSVSPHKEIFYCFGCQAGGDVISFVSKIEQCSPLEAARFLVERYSIALPADITWEKNETQEEAKKKYYQTCTTFALWCAQQLENYQSAHQYVSSRGISPESIKNFQIGYCPTEIKQLLLFAQKEGLMAQDFIDAQIIFEGRTGLYTPFEDRIMFPIKDLLGRTVGFGGRVYKQEDTRAKYYNSQEHSLFNKGTLLYGLDRSKKIISERAAAFLVEGYTDLIVMHQYGFTNAIATLGTACTAEHLAQLSRYAEKLYVLYDGDTAGQNAVLRLTELCWQVAIDPYVLTLPAQEDPASFLVNGGDLTQAIAQAKDIFSFVIFQTGIDFNQKSLQDRIAITTKIITLISQLHDPIKRNLLLKQASDTFTLPIETLKSAAEKRSSRAPAGHTQEKDNTLSVPDGGFDLMKISQLEKKLFSAILYYKGKIDTEDEHMIHYWMPEPFKKLFGAVVTCRTTQGVNLQLLFEQLTQEEKTFVSARIAESQELEQEDSPENMSLEATWEQLILQFYKKQWKSTVHDVKLKVQVAQQAGNTDQVKILLTELDTVKKMMIKRGIS